MIGLCLAAVSCRTPDTAQKPRDSQRQTPPEGASTADADSPAPRDTVDPKAALRARAETYWAAQVAEDWATVFECLDPGIRSEWEKAEFIEWSAQNEPFLIRQYQINDVQVSDYYGWVDVDYTTNIRQFPDVPAKDANKLEKWWRKDGAWYVVPQQLLEQVPAPPAERDQEAEAALKERWKASWDARINRDWRKLWDLIDPRDKVGVLYEEFAEAEGLIEYFSHELYWVQVIGDDGKVRVNYEHRLHDPNLTKMRPIFKPVTEKWSYYEGQWYLNKQ